MFSNSPSSKNAPISSAVPLALAVEIDGGTGAFKKEKSVSSQATNNKAGAPTKKYQKNLTMLFIPPKNTRN